MLLVTLRSQECIAAITRDHVAVSRDRYVIISRDHNALPQCILGTGALRVAGKAPEEDRILTIDTIGIRQTQVIAIGSTGFPLSFGAVAAIKENIILIKILTGILLLFFAAEIIVGTSAYSYRDELHRDLLSRFYEGDGQARVEEPVTSAVDGVQQRFQCCGAENFIDWFNVSSGIYENSVPSSCCRLPHEKCGEDAPGRSEILYQEGCVMKMWTAEHFACTFHEIFQKMRKSGGRDRGRWLPAGTDGGGASGGSGKSTIAPKAGGVEPASSSGYTRPRRLPYLGVGKQLLKPEQQEKVLAFLADSASSSFASSSESSKYKSSESSVDAPGQEQDVSLCPSPKPKVKDVSGDTTGYSMELFTHTVPGLEREIVNCPLQHESDMECTDAQPQLDYYAVPLTQITTLPSQCTEPESDPDETMVPRPERYSTLHGDTEEGAHDIEEEVIDDPVVDPDWQPLGEEGVAASSSEAEEDDRQQTSTSQQLSSCRPVSGQKRLSKTKTVLGQRGQPVKVAQRAMPV
ncbi:unnamed protein product [Ranitomeya imitator]|uniref:Tetraspanin n=1 Tax=Ranitomeya imitator TaxID=111125 RepID=A0ABN9LVV8_9NEOB|nr:unnamed protein product [Ranitomeya imitator]